jgi:hypothetical protein
MLTHTETLLWWTDTTAQDIGIGAKELELALSQPLDRSELAAHLRTIIHQKLHEDRCERNFHGLFLNGIFQAGTIRRKTQNEDCFCRHDASIKERLDILESTSESMSSDIAEMKTGIAEMKTGIERLLAAVTS